MAMALNLPPLSPFDVHTDPAGIGVRWAKWVRSFKLYLMASGIKDDAQKRILLLHLGGWDVQDIFVTMEDTGNDKDYEVALRNLNNYFTQKNNVLYERHIFWLAVQEQGESVDSFVSRLKQLAVMCDFGDHKDDLICDQVIDKCTSTALRRRLLREKDLTLSILQDIARTIEAADQQAAKMEKLNINAVGKGNILHVSTQFAEGKPQSKYKSSAFSQQSTKHAHQLTCHRCGRVRHYGKMCIMLQKGNSVALVAKRATLQRFAIPKQD